MYAVKKSVLNQSSIFCFGCFSINVLKVFIKCSAMKVMTRNIHRAKTMANITALAKMKLLIIIIVFVSTASSYASLYARCDV